MKVQIPCSSDYNAKLKLFCDVSNIEELKTFAVQGDLVAALIKPSIVRFLYYRSHLVGACCRMVPQSVGRLLSVVCTMTRFWREIQIPIWCLSGAHDHFIDIVAQGRSNGLKGGGDTKISARAFGARMDFTRNFSAKIFSIVFARQS